MGERTFLAIDIDDAVRSRLARLGEEIRDSEARVNWVAPENLHVTLKFLGDVPDSLAAEVCKLAAQAAAQAAPFEFEVRGVICVPPSGPLKMLWAGVLDATGGMANLYELLDDALADLGVRQENRAFKPHITLARVKSARNPRWLREAAAPFEKEEFGAVAAGEVTVYNSILDREGPMYTPIAHAKLGE